MINYTQFASRISFFEFVEEEFYSPHINPDDYKNEIEAVSNATTTDDLIRLLEKYPRSFDLFEEFFQLRRFTNTQYAHFLFDVTKLNQTDLKLIEKHAKETIFKHENGVKNELYAEVCGDIDSDDVDVKIMHIKRAVVAYLKEVLKPKKRKALYEHLSNSIGARYRIATYLTEQLNALEYLKGINFLSFLSLKRIPKDGKSVIGRYGTSRITNILNSNTIPCVNDKVNEKILQLNEPNTTISGWSYVSEKMIDTVTKRKGKNKLKKFDFILLKDGVPHFCIETNFYSTTGTKIGINIGEYTDLRDDINTLNEQLGTTLKFIWITDGGHWLSSDGEVDFTTMKERYFMNDWELLNYNLFSDMLPKLMR